MNARKRQRSKTERLPTGDGSGRVSEFDFPQHWMSHQLARRSQEVLQEITITNLKIGEASVDLSIQRYAHGVGVDLVQRRGAIDILVRK